MARHINNVIDYHGFPNELHEGLFWKRSNLIKWPQFISASLLLTPECQLVWSKLWWHSYCGDTSHWTSDRHWPRLDMDTLGQTRGWGSWSGDNKTVLQNTQDIIQFFVSFIQCAGCKPVQFNSHLHLVWPSAGLCTGPGLLSTASKEHTGQSEASVMTAGQSEDRVTMRAVWPSRLRAVW